MHRSLVAFIGLGLAVGLAVAGCASSGSGGSKPKPGQADETPAPVSILGKWLVVSLEDPLGRRVPPASAGRVEIEFAPSQPGVGAVVSGSAGLNRFTGKYSFAPGERDTGAISFGTFRTTKMAGPADAMEFEQILLDVLATSRTVTREGGGLVIDTADARVWLAPG